MLIPRDATTEDLQECLQHLLATHRGLVRRMERGGSVLGEVQSVRRQIRAIQFQLLLRNQKEAM